MTRAAPRRRAEKQRGRRVAERVPAYVDPGSPDAVDAAPRGARSTSRPTSAPAPRRHARASEQEGTKAETPEPATQPAPLVPPAPATTPATAAPTAAAHPARSSSADPSAGPSAGPSTGRRLGRAGLVLLWVVVVVVGLAGLGARVVDVGPELVGGLGAVLITTAYAWALAARTGGRPVIFSSLALVVGAVVLALDRDELRTGAAVVVAGLAAVLGVMATVPARRFPQVVRETVIAVVIAAVGTLAALGFEPAVTVSRFQYAVLACAIVCAFGLVYRLGAGLHGLGRRGVLVVVVGGLMLVVTLLYAELIRRYGTPGLVGSLHDGVAWSRDHLGGYPRPIEALVGIPSLAWGTHMRARRRQGWWVCAFGVALTAPVASTLLNPDIGVVESLISIGYGLVVGLVIGFVVIRVDLALTGYPSRGDLHRPVGRRAAREAEDASAVRPEPARTRALL